MCFGTPNLYRMAFFQHFLLKLHVQRSPGLRSYKCENTAKMLLNTPQMSQVNSYNFLEKFIFRPQNRLKVTFLHFFSMKEKTFLSGYPQNLNIFVFKSDFIKNYCPKRIATCPRCRLQVPTSSK